MVLCPGPIWKQFRECLNVTSSLDGCDRMNLSLSGNRCAVRTYTDQPEASIEAGSVASLSVGLALRP